MNKINETDAGEMRSLICLKHAVIEEISLQ